MNAKPITEKTKGWWIRRILPIIFFLVITLGGIYVLTFGYLLPWRNTQVSRNWQEVPCEVLDSRVRTHSDEGRTNYSVVIRYAYKLKGQRYESTRYDFNLASFRSHRECQQIVQGYREQKQGTCFVDPDSPQSSVIERDADLELVNLILGIVFPVAAVSGLLHFLRWCERSAVDGLKFNSSASAKNGMAQKVSVGTLSADVDDQKKSSPQRLNSSSTRIGKFVGVVLLTLIWNGFVGMFLLGALNWSGFTAFPFLFVLIGAIFMLGTIACFLSLFIPQVEIATTTGAVARGQAMDVAWKINGNPNWIKRLRIAAVGSENEAEEINYRLGKRWEDCYVASSDFVSIRVADTTEQQDIAFGSTSVTIPADTMHTLDSGNNKIIWVLHVKAEINWWPDVKEKYEFRVKP